MVAHISEQNNCRERVLEALQPVWARCEDITWADQGDGFDWLYLV